MHDDNFLEGRLAARKAENSLRSLKLPPGGVDFTSNDYLGLVRDGKLLTPGSLAHGSTGSRLLSGNSALATGVEELIARFHDAPSALLFNSGYDANLGLLSAVLQKEDTVIYDFLSHASIRDGIKLGKANAYSFLHNDTGDLERRLKQATGNIFVVTESVFSMDGDVAPLNRISELCERYHAHLIVDEAHATGVTGPMGAGIIQQLALQHKCFARVHTFGKALGCHGAVVLGSQQLKNYLINFSRALIYTTALPASALDAIARSYMAFPVMDEERMHLSKMITIFQEAELKYVKLKSDTPIQGVVIPGNDEVRKVAETLAMRGFDVRPILYPTVPKGSERLRVIIHSFNTEEEVRGLLTPLLFEEGQGPKAPGW